MFFAHCESKLKPILYIFFTQKIFKKYRFKSDHNTILVSQNEDMKMDTFI